MAKIVQSGDSSLTGICICVKKILNLNPNQKAAMLNFRKLKQDYSPGIIKEGKLLYDKGMVVSGKITSLSTERVRIHCKVLGNFDNTYSCQLEIDRKQSMAIDSDCDCAHNYDCQHLSGILFYLEEKFDELLIAYSHETDLEKTISLDEGVKASLRATFKEAESKQVIRQGKKYQKEVLEEYLGAAHILGRSPFFVSYEEPVQGQAELAIIFSPGSVQSNQLELQFALKLPFRSKPLNIAAPKDFFDALKYHESIYLGGKRYFFSLQSFDEASALLLKMMTEALRFPEAKEEKQQRNVLIDKNFFGSVLAHLYEFVTGQRMAATSDENSELEVLPCLYFGGLEEPLRFALSPARLRISLERLAVPEPKLLLSPSIIINADSVVPLEEATLFECAKAGMIYKNAYYVFNSSIRRQHLCHLAHLREVTIPEPLFGTFIENSLPQLLQFADVANRHVLEDLVTLPFVGDLRAECQIHYLHGELEAQLHFIYDHIQVPAAASQTLYQHIIPFVTQEGILARNLTEEQKIIEALFQDFTFEPVQGVFIAKTEKKIIEFMTELLPAYQGKVQFHCPENLLEQFIYDETNFKFELREGSRVDVYELSLKVEGNLKGFTVDQLWDCLTSRRTFIPLASKKVKKKGEEIRHDKILVLDLDKLSPLIQLFDELGIKNLTDHSEERPLWSLANVDTEQLRELGIQIAMTEKLKKIQQQILGISPFLSSPIPQEIQAVLRSYQEEGVQWLERLRSMHLSGILADDMGLGKTLQAIIAITQYHALEPHAISLIICPTSLVYNWKEEIAKFNPNLRVLPVDGTPAQRKKLLNDIKQYDIIVTSYTLLQKDVEFYKKIIFFYAILDEAQHIKNRDTRNAKSVKMIQANHRLILTGTPIENSLDELWSLFDFLMPGLLSSYDRFFEKFVRNPFQAAGKNMEALRKKVSPFILRRMKKDVIADLPPVSHIVYHCHLTDKQRELYQSYASSAREELTQLVKKEGFDRVQIHVLATLTRLKQICCHPAIFAKDSAEPGDSAKYNMLQELLQTLIEGNHKTVIFSQYTRMLNIIRADLEKQRIRFEYLDGTSKNRLSIVKKFNEDSSIPIFLVSLKAGGSGLNLVGADTVIHYDMWWNPAVENQATDRVHRIGQKCSVSSYKLVTLNTVEEKILELQRRKSGLVTQVVTCDEEAIAKLTWEEVLELLQA